ncbi:MAG TPA: 23S rRNA pseudouridine(1911/1915/1917) synthase RluD [Pseudomonadales bacterium]|nr:23S rRNA pseudouridine(1911/1915/1917) synthase RluD [Pseudomonadales bacterium]
MSTFIHEIATVPGALALERLDRAAVHLFPQFSRARLQRWIKSGELTVDGELRRPKDKVEGGEELEIEATLSEMSHAPEPIPLAVIHEDDAVIVIDKPAGLVVHPGAGNLSGTLLNGLLHHCAALASVPRAGIVHRLDKDTTGLLVVAKTLESQNALVQQLQARQVHRIYFALVHGVVTTRGTVDAPIGRHPTTRTRMAVQASGKQAITHYRVVTRYPGHSLLEVSLETGRTHQIRVHMSHIGHPLVGDPTYGGRQTRRRVPPELSEALDAMPRQALHAKALSFEHPETGQQVTFESDLPHDMEELLEAMESVS